MQQRNQPITTPKHVAILFLSALGDFLLGLPLISEVRRVYPDARLTLICQRPAVGALAAATGAADEVITLPSEARRSLPALTHSLLLLRRLSADVVLLTFSSHGAFGNLLAGASRAPARVGFGSGRFQNLLTHRVPVSENQHRVLLNLSLLRRLGHAQVQPPDGRYLPDMERHSVSYPLGAARQKHGQYLLLSLGSDPKLAFKRWPARHWTDLSARLTADGCNLVFVGDKSQRAEIAHVIEGAGIAAANLAGTTSFEDLAALVGASQAVIATDGMVLHLASAMNKASVGVFGPTHPDIGGPWGSQHKKAYLNLPCSPCYGSHTIGKGAGCATRECLTHLSAEMVYQKVQNALSDLSSQCLLKEGH